MATSNFSQQLEEFQMLPKTQQISAGFDLPYSGLTKEELQELSVDEIYQKMSNNLRQKNNMDFEARCLALFA